MLLSVFKKSKRLIRPVGIILLLGLSQAVWAAGPPEPSAFSNPLAITFIILIVLLLIIIGILANVLLGAADIKVRKNKKSSAPTVIGSMVILLLLSCGSLFAQVGAFKAETTVSTASTVGGMAASAFYVMASVIFLELILIIILLINIRFLLKLEKEKVETSIIKIQTAAERKSRLSWWDKFNKFRPVTQESELDLGHDYDGIRELNNRLPPWWIYGFYLTIIIAGIYFWRYHVSHTAPSSKEEFEISMTNGDRKVEQYLKMKGDNVDENTVTLLTGAEDIAAGKAIFNNPQNCITCHREDAGGNVGPNLTDDYWLYGGNIKEIFKIIKYGTNKGMRSWKDDLSAKQMAQVAGYIKSLHGTNPLNPKEHQGELYNEEPIAKPAGDSIKTLNDSMKVNNNKVVMN
ncbi:MAG: cbb3-type cytochrome c oxidase N-terminal domain-containing protein [Chitinophagales bacterium]